MATLKPLIVSVIAVVLIAAWYLFRPELIFVTTTVDEPPADGTTSAETLQMMAPRILAQGRFRSVAHESTGLATIYQQTNGGYILRLTEFETSNGPDVRVYLVAAQDAPDHTTVTAVGFIDLGSLKGTRGNQNYAIPDTVDLHRYQSVTIWCARFRVNFATAPLMPQS